MITLCPPAVGAPPSNAQDPVLYAASDPERPGVHRGTVTSSSPSSISQLREFYTTRGQDHVFGFWGQLAQDGRDRLATQAKGIAGRLDAILSARARAVAELDRRDPLLLEPCEVIRAHGQRSDRAAIETARARGEVLLSQGRIAVFVVAGGQGTRLGFPGPKGAFPVGPVSRRSLFELQAQKIRALSRRAGCPIPWVVMTSDATDTATGELFESAKQFGVPRRDVRIFRQETVPAFDFEGRLLLEAPDRIAESPDGHGGSITALACSGVLDELEARGVDTLFYYQVDNPLVRMADPVYLGLHADAGAEMSCKVVRKRDPEEKVGVVARVAGRPMVVEYTELDDAHRDARDERGELVYAAGNVAIHLLDTAFVRRIAARADELLPFHASPKKILSIDGDGRTIEPCRPNGHKLERFVFDALPHADGVCVVEVDAGEEFAPIKNAQGTDSPETARSALTAQYRSWLRRAGVEVPSHVQQIEIDHSRIDGPADLRALDLHGVDEAGDLIRVNS